MAVIGKNGEIIPNPVTWNKFGQTNSKNKPIECFGELESGDKVFRISGWPIEIVDITVHTVNNFDGNNIKISFTDPFYDSIIVGKEEFANVFHYCHGNYIYCCEKYLDLIKYIYSEGGNSSRNNFIHKFKRLLELN